MTMYAPTVGKDCLTKAEKSILKYSAVIGRQTCVGVS